MRNRRKSSKFPALNTHTESATCPDSANRSSGQFSNLPKCTHMVGQTQLATECEIIAINWAGIRPDVKCTGLIDWVCVSAKCDRRANLGGDYYVEGLLFYFDELLYLLVPSLSLCWLMVNKPLWWWGFVPLYANECVCRVGVVQLFVGNQIEIVRL